MKQKRRLLSCFLAVSLTLGMSPAEGLLDSAYDLVTTVDAASPGDKLSVGYGTSQHKGTSDGYSYEIWIDQTGGNGTMTLGQGASFKAEWSANVSAGNFLARRGLDFGSKQKATDYEYIGLDYEADYRQTGSANGNSRLCVYGWFQNKGAAGNVPLVEYYIIEDWVDWCPDAPGKMVTIDGAQYKIFQMDHTGPTINGGSETFKQYFSVRQDKRTSGHITVSDHFKAWAAQGWGIGNLYEVALNAEGWQSSGVADIKKLDVYTTPKGDTGYTPPTTETPQQPSIQGTAPSGSGTGISDGFEGSGTTWTGRGDGVKLLLTSDLKSGGSKSLAVTGRTASWNGVSASSSELKAGGSYSFSSQVTYKNSNYASSGFEFGVQYDLNGKTNYDNIGSATTSSGKWTELSGDFKIPAGAENISLYIQSTYSESDTAADLIDFFVDDVELSGGSTSGSGNTGSDNTGNNNTGNSNSSSMSPNEYLEQAKQSFTSNVPADVKSGDKGKTSKITYYSKKAQRNKPANVWLPPNYSESEKYPVVYMNHGIMGGEDDLLTGWSIREMASNLIEKGEVKPFIIVFTQMYTDPKAERPSGITQESTDRYDDFLYDLTESLMPYMSEHYSIAEGRENTAIAGFSMGGRESLYIGMKAADKIGYVCASSPAPGIVPAKDMFLDHRGSMTEAEFGFSASNMPYLLMIGGGTADQVVGTFPKQYHELYEKKGIDHIWFEVQGGGHDASVGTPLFYNFFRNLFKASGSNEPAVTTPVVTTTPAPVTTTSEVEPVEVKGDIDGNGAVTATDVVKLMQAMIGKISLTSQQTSRADIDGNGKISIVDLIKLKNMLI